MSENSVESPLRPVSWLGAFLGISTWAAYHAIKTAPFPLSASFGSTETCA